MSLETSRIGSRLDLLHLITREFNAKLDIDQVLYNILSATVASVGASDASLLLFDPGGNPEHGLTISGFEVQQQNPTILQTMAEGALVGWVRKHKQAIIIKDIHNGEHSFYDYTESELQGVGSLICVPIQLADQLIGVLTITTPQRFYFSDNDLELLMLIADHAAFAIENARLFEAEQDRRQLADTLISINQTINSTLNVNEVLSLILEQLRLVVDYDSSSVLLYEDNGRMLAVQAARGFKDLKDALNVKLPFNEESPNFQAILQKKPIVISDVDSEPYWVKSSSSQNVHSWIGAPLIARDEAVGILTVDSNTINKYSKENVRIVAAFADLASTAVANAQAVTQLQNAEDTYAALFEDSTDMIFITDYDGIIIDINRKACQILRRHKEIFINTPLTVINPKLNGYLSEQTRRLKLWREAAIELDIKDAYRQTVSLEIKVRQIQFRGKEAVEWVGRDISARKELERMRQDMVNMLVHDLRGPLGNLLNIIELISMMMDTEPDSSKIAKFLDMAKRSGQTIKDLVDSILDVSRLEQGEVPLQRIPTNLNELIQAMREQVLPHATAKQMKLTIEPLPEITEVWVDSSLIRRVLINLVGNAIKYTPREGLIVLKTTISNEILHFSISDNGPGISEADKTRIFDKFSRVDYSANTPAGVGLGLAFCKLAVEAHDGTLSVESDGIAGKGSIFHVIIPMNT